MPLDPAQGFATTTDGRTAERLAELTRRLEVLERSTAIVTAGAGAPGSAVTSRFYVDETNNRLYVRVAGTFRYTALT